MTFHEFLKVKKGIDPKGKNLAELMDEYYDEYIEFMRGKKDGCPSGE